MSLSAFNNKDNVPTDLQLLDLLGDKIVWWKSVETYCLGKWPTLVGEWNFSGANYGWNFRLKDKKRAVIYLIPTNSGFMTALIFGQKAYEAVLQSDVDGQLKYDLQNAKPYAEGRGIRFAINQLSQLDDVRKLIDIKQLVR